MNGIKEKYLLFKAKSFNDADAYGQIYDRYVERIYRFIFFKVGSKADAEDITSEAFLKTWQYIKEGKPIKNLNAFLYTVARNLVVDHYRTQAKKREFEEEMIFDIGGDTNIAEKMDIRGEAGKILQAMKTLKEEYREIVVMRFMDELSVGEIAKIIDKTSNNTRVLVHRALAALKKVLETGNEQF